ncbi:MAG: hypothetical protein ABF778_08465 [Liquorilactobacillus hordei]|uniref:LURP-one-related/scramblase family protein n=1 Tax=Liquorilactobacillus hordei TaxID=468911 RepID=UPI0039E75901
MRNLYAHRHRLSTQGATKIVDQNSKAIYLVVGNWGRHQDVLSVYAISGELLAQIKQRGFGIFPKFELFLNTEKVGFLRRINFGNRDLILIKGLNWMVVGNIVNFTYKIYHKQTLIMSLQEVMLSSGKFLELTVNNKDDEPLCLAIVAILDYFASSSQRKRKSRYQLQVKYD